jgi:myo-inositol-1(or 4)-monophosphatase
MVQRVNAPAIAAGTPHASLLASIVQAAEAGARVIHAGAARRDTLVWNTKGPADYLTEVDTGAEHAIRATLEHTFPGTFILGEEGWQGEVVGSELCFVVDPLDGTTNFLHGVPEYAVSIAAVEDGVPVAGVVLNAARGDCYTATRGGGAFLDGAPLRVSTIDTPARALIATGFPFGENASIPRYLRQFARVAQATAGIRRPGAASLDFANVATGRYDAFWEIRLSPWDIAAGIVLIREAGGIVTDFAGHDARVERGEFIAGNPAMHRWLLHQIQQADFGTEELTV